MKNNITDFITTKQAAAKMGYTTHGITKAIRDGRLKAIRKTNGWLIHRLDLACAFRDGAGRKKT